MQEMVHRHNDILIVEDDAEVSFVFKLLLADEGFDVSVAPNGLVAMEIVDSHQPDLILLDLHMPIMDGETFAARFRDEYGANTPIIVITAVPPPALEERIENAVVLKKPVELDLLLETIDRFLIPQQSSHSAPRPFY
jgi:CheY-like chemotaxis protein